jgi:Na+/proline symporter
MTAVERPESEAVGRRLRSSGVEAPTGHRHGALVVLASLNAVAATGGAWGLAAGTLGLGGDLEARLPLGSAALGGVALFLAVAVPNAVVAGLAWRRDRRTGAVAVATGMLLIVWIVVELGVLRELSFFHPLYVAIGLAMVGLGRRADKADA